MPGLIAALGSLNLRRLEFYGNPLASSYDGQHFAATLEVLALRGFVGMPTDEHPEPPYTQVLRSAMTGEKRLSEVQLNSLFTLLLPRPFHL